VLVVAAAAGWLLLLLLLLLLLHLAFFLAVFGLLSNGLHAIECLYIGSEVYSAVKCE
jgi:hypothetical protein